MLHVEWARFEIMVGVRCTIGIAIPLFGGLAAGRPAAAMFGALGARVGTLLAEADRHIPGRVDPETGEVVLGEGGVDDVLDDIAELVLKNGGQVVVTREAQMPTKTGIAAIYRY